MATISSPHFSSLQEINIDNNQNSNKNERGRDAFLAPDTHLVPTSPRPKEKINNLFLLKRSNSLPYQKRFFSLASTSGLASQHERHLPESGLDIRYGKEMPPNPKGKKSGIYLSEFNVNDPSSAMIHPERIVFKLNDSDSVKIQKLKDLFEKIKNGTRAKWIISRNGSLVVGPAIVSGETHDKGGDNSKVGLKLGHPTLIGGIPNPKGRIGGEIIYGIFDENKEPVIYINNDSGRYSKYGNLHVEHLENAAKFFESLGFSIHYMWVDLDSKPKKIKNTTV